MLAKPAGDSGGPHFRNINGISAVVGITQGCFQPSLELKPSIQMMTAQQMTPSRLIFILTSIGLKTI